MNLKRLGYQTLFPVVLAIISAGPAFAQEAVSGTWKAELREKEPEALQISFRSEKSEGDHNFGSNIEFERIQGLAPQQVLGPASAVSFSIPSEAGVIYLTGTVENKRGKGDFKFTPDPNFSARVNEIGFKDVGAERLFASAVLNVKLDTVSELRSSGLRVTDYEDVFKATIFKVDAGFIAEMSQAGFSNLNMEDLVKARIFKIDAAYAREINAMGFGDQSMENLVKFRIFKITPEFLSEVKQEGFVDLDPEQLVQLRIFKIDSEFIREMRDKGYANPTVEELVQLKIRGKLN